MHPRDPFCNINNYVGLPFSDKGRGPDTFDCWGLVQWFYMKELGLKLPDYLVGYETVADKSVATVIESAKLVGWECHPDPKPLSVVLFNIFGKPLHVGLVLKDGFFLHAPEGDYSRLERLSAPGWVRRIEGFYSPILGNCETASA